MDRLSATTELDFLHEHDHFHQWRIYVCGRWVPIPRFWACPLLSTGAIALALNFESRLQKQLVFLQRRSKFGSQCLRNALFGDFNIRTAKGNGGAEVYAGFPPQNAVPVGGNWSGP